MFKNFLSRLKYIKVNACNRYAPKFYSLITASQATDVEHMTWIQVTASQHLKCLSVKVLFPNLTDSQVFNSKTKAMQKLNFKKSLLCFLFFHKEKKINVIVWGLLLPGLQLFSIAPEEI